MTEYKTTQKRIRENIIIGFVNDVSKWACEDVYKLIESGTVRKVCYSVGKYGVNGQVIEIDGDFYGVASRCSNLFIIM